MHASDFYATTARYKASPAQQTYLMLSAEAAAGYAIADDLFVRVWRCQPSFQIARWANDLNCTSRAPFRHLTWQGSRSLHLMRSTNVCGMACLV